MESRKHPEYFTESMIRCAECAIKYGEPSIETCENCMYGGVIR